MSSDKLLNPMWPTINTYRHGHHYMDTLDCIDIFTDLYMSIYVVIMGIMRGVRVGE